LRRAPKTAVKRAALKNALAALLLLGAVSKARGQSDRYLYVLSCDARVGKVDTVLDRQVSLRPLHIGSSKKQVIPQVEPNGTMDGCLVNGVAFDAKASIFYTVVPNQVRLKADGTKDYRMVGFRVPGLALVKVAPAGIGLAETPHLELGVGLAQPKVLSASEWSPRTDLDVSTFSPEKEEIRNQILEQSGVKVLLRVFAQNRDDLALAVADRNMKSVVKLKDTVSTTAKNVHLTPGGQAVLVEETNGVGVKTGNVVLYDAKTGQEIKRVADSKVRTMSFLAISPNGKGIYHLGDAYGFLSLGRKFSGGSVVRLLNADSYPPIFFAGR
jgi:hypothetical protein